MFTTDFTDAAAPENVSTAFHVLGNGLDGPALFTRAPDNIEPNMCITHNNGYWLICSKDLTEQQKHAVKDLAQSIQYHTVGVIDPAPYYANQRVEAETMANQLARSLKVEAVPNLPEKPTGWVFRAKAIPV